MKFVRGKPNDAVVAIANRLRDELAKGKRVLWLTSGGSNTSLEVAIMRQVSQQSAQFLPHLAIMPMDERYGEPGHKDSNVQALREAGFDPGGAVWIDILQHNVPFSETVSFYTDVVAAALAGASVVVGQFGIGPDGHIAGLLPQSPALAPGSTTVTGFEWGDYTRLTLSPEALKQITVAYAPSFGESKLPALKRLQANTESFEQLPAKLLYELPEVYVYNDELESEAST